MQRTASSSSLGSTNENQTEVKLESAVSLIDFDADPEPPVTAPVMQSQQPTIVHSNVPPTSTSNSNWASFDVSPEVKASQAPSSFVTLESVFSQLTVPASVPLQVSGVSSGTGASSGNMGNVTGFPGNGTPTSVGGSAIAPFSTAAPVAGPPAPASGFATFPSDNLTGQVWTQVSPANSGNTFSMQHQQPSLFPVGSQSNAPQVTTPIDGSSSYQVCFIV